MVLPWFTFHEGRHTHATPRRARWRAALARLTAVEQDRLGGWFPHVKQTLLTLPGSAQRDGDQDGKTDAIAISSPLQH